MMFKISLAASSGTQSEAFPSAVDIYLFVSFDCVSSWIFTLLLVWCPRVWKNIPHPQYRRRIGSECVHCLTIPLRTG